MQLTTAKQTLQDNRPFFTFEKLPGNTSGLQSNVFKLDFKQPIYVTSTQTFMSSSERPVLEKMLLLKTRQHCFFMGNVPQG